MKYINLPESLESIGEGALAYNSFTTITIPKNVKVIDDYAFSNCHDLKKVTLSEGLLSLGEIHWLWKFDKYQFARYLTAYWVKCIYWYADYREAVWSGNTVCG